jgi:hypothetical protein
VKLTLRADQVEDARKLIGWVRSGSCDYPWKPGEPSESSLPGYDKWRTRGDFTCSRWADALEDAIKEVTT